MAVRTKRLWGISAATTSGPVLYTVPSGETAIVKSIAGGPAPLGGLTLDIRLNGASAGNRFYGVDIASGTWLKLDGLFWVFQPGDTLRFFTSTGSLNVIGFGTELEGFAD